MSVPSEGSGAPVPGEALLSVVKGEPTSEELAALTAVVAPVMSPVGPIVSLESESSVEFATKSVPLSGLSVMPLG